MSVMWAERRVKNLLKVEEGERRLDWELNRPLEWYIENQAFSSPARTNFYNAVALTVCGYPAEARLCLDKAEEIIHAAFEHERDRGTWGFSYKRARMHTYMYAGDWLLRGTENREHLVNAAAAMEEGMRRSLADGWEVGPEGYRDPALFRLLLGDGEAALAAAHKMAERPLAVEPESLTKGKPTKAKTLALAAHAMVHPEALPRDHYRQAIDCGIVATLKEDATDDVGNPDELFLWLRLRERILERSPDPWEMLRSLPALLNA